MRYFIGNLIRGEAAEYYKATCAELKERFGVEDVSQIVPPHITVKSPFERSGEALDVDDLLSLSTDNPTIPLELSGWGHFTNRTIFIDAPNTPEALQKFIKEMHAKLKNICVSTTPQEANTHIHMSVARFLNPNQYEAIWKHLTSMPAPKFDIKFDNLTLFVKEKITDKAWKIYKTYPLLGK